MSKQGNRCDFRENQNSDFGEQGIKAIYLTFTREQVAPGCILYQSPVEKDLWPVIVCASTVEYIKHVRKETFPKKKINKK